ncbi:MAG: hypothetical protein PWQ82_415 [Thermosediminibacterales bacterium]|nr:hypothetical protein [Thermosediminibacterales bacterium]
MSSKILKNCIDIHVHSGPGLFPRTVDDFQLAQEALKAEMRAVVLKAHEGSTVFRAHLVNRRLGREILIGSIVLNSFVGGFNPDAVDCAVKLGARVVWMPTISAQNHLNHYGSCNYSNMNTNSETRPLKPQRIFDEKGDIKPEVKEILEIIRDSDVCIATSHLSLEESLKLIDEALQMGIRKILLNHPEAGVTRVDLEIQKELAKRGVFIEKAYLWATAGWQACLTLISFDQYPQTLKINIVH